jgi:hypothetical protein
MKIRRFNEGFEPIVGQRKLSDSFMKTANLVIDLIESNEDLHYLKDMAKEVKVFSSEMRRTDMPQDPAKVVYYEFCDELQSCFSKINFKMEEHLIGGVNLPFIGRVRLSSDGSTDEVSLKDYIITKLGGFKERA